jgi:hypothetical protein
MRGKSFPHIDMVASRYGEAVNYTVIVALDAEIVYDPHTS